MDKSLSNQVIDIIESESVDIETKPEESEEYYEDENIQELIYESSSNQENNIIEKYKPKNIELESIDVEKKLEEPEEYYDKVEDENIQELIYETMEICKHCGRWDNDDPDEHHISCQKVPKCKQCGSRDGPHICN